MEVADEPIVAAQQVVIIYQAEGVGGGGGRCGASTCVRQITAVSE